jgi:hypothetical protein
MKKIFYTGTDKIWKGFEAPEKPDRCHYCDGIEHRIYFLCEKCQEEFNEAEVKYNQAYAAARAAALPIANPEMIKMGDIQEKGAFIFPKEVKRRY